MGKDGNGYCASRRLAFNSTQTKPTPSDGLTFTTYCLVDNMTMTYARNQLLIQ